MPQFHCQLCSQTFEVPQRALDKYPGWKPKVCMSCRNQGLEKPEVLAKRRPLAPTSSKRSPRTTVREENLSVAEVLAKYTEGPQDGVFTDGAAHPNPGAGGWGAVYVRNGEIIAEAFGHEAHTTNNRMELMALIEGFQLVPKGVPAVVWTDSQLCVNTITQWAKGWAKAGWKRKTGPIKNLELVQRLYALSLERPELELRWIQAHSGNRWNEYADALSTAYRRSER